MRLPTLFDFLPFDILWIVGLEQVIVDFKPDIIIVHGVVSISSIRVAMLKSKLSETKIVFDDHMTYNAIRGRWVYLLYSFFSRVFKSLLLRNVDHFVAVTKETKCFMEEHYRIPACRIKVIPLGVDGNTFYYDSIARSEIRRKYGITQDDVVFVYIGKKTPTKGVHFFIKAAIELCKKHLNVKIMLVGGGESSYIEKLKEMIRMEKLENRFTFIEAVLNKQLYRYISAGDVGVWPLQCSISMLEAMSCGLPIIISDKSGALERISEGTGLFWHEGNLTDLQAKMEDMLDESRRKGMSRNAENYIKKLDWQDIAEQFLFDINKKKE